MLTEVVVSLPSPRRPLAAAANVWGVRARGVGSALRCAHLGRPRALNGGEKRKTSDCCEEARRGKCQR